MPEEPRYLAYLVRLWLTGHGEDVGCRAMLLDPHSNRQQGFPDLDSLFAYIRRAAQDGATSDREREAEKLEGSMPIVQWLIIVLLLAAVALILCEPVCRGHRTR